MLRRYRRRCTVIQAGGGVASRQSWVEYRNRDLYLVKAVFGAVQAWLLQMLWLDPDETAYAAHITVWTRWFLWIGAMISLALRPTFTYPQSIPQSIPFLILHLALVTLNGWVHYRLVSRRRVTWRHVFALSALDITFVTATVVDGGYDTSWFVAYYAALAAFAAVFTSPLLNLTWTTITASIYVGVSLTVGSGIALDGIDGKALYVRVVGMFGVVLPTNLKGHADAATGAWGTGDAKASDRGTSW